MIRVWDLGVAIFRGLGGGVVANANQTTKTNFWLDIADGYGDPSVWRMRERVFVGDATLFPGTRANATGAWLSSATGANWIIRDSQLGVMQSRGCIALSGMSRASDGDDLVSCAPIGVAGGVINNTTLNSRGAWAFYAEVQHEPGGTGCSTFGMEMGVKNKGANVIGTPYALGGGAIGLWLAGGSDNTYGGASVNPSNAAMVVVKNSNTFNKGIIFSKDALTGSDGTTGAAVAIEMARGHSIRWLQTGSLAGAQIRSDVDISGRDVSLVFLNNLLSFFGGGGTNLFFARHDLAASIGSVNYVSVGNAPVGGTPFFAVEGTDTDVDLWLKPKGVGVVRFGTKTFASVTPDGYITIKDSAGNTVKLVTAA